MKRKCLIISMAILLLLSLGLTAFATEPDGPWVVDNAGLLSGEEEAELNRKIQTLRNELELEIVIVTTYGTGSKSVQEYADDFYDTSGYGYGSNATGILLLVDMESREWYMSTCGDAIYIFTDYGLSLLGDGLVRWLSEGMYFEAFDLWLDSLRPYVDAYNGGTPVDGYVQPDEYESPYGDEIYYYDDHTGIGVQPFPIALIIGLVSAIVTILVMRSSMNTAKLQNSAANYLKDGTFHLRQRSDRFLYSRVTKTARPKNNTSGGGGSSVHRSSGGVSHGGRGGRF